MMAAINQNGLLSALYITQDLIKDVGFSCFFFCLGWGLHGTLGGSGCCAGEDYRVRAHMSERMRTQHA